MLEAQLGTTSLLKKIREYKLETLYTRMRMWKARGSEKIRGKNYEIYEIKP